jgi:hypothetical protein
VREGPRRRTRGLAALIVVGPALTAAVALAGGCGVGERPRLIEPSAAGGQPGTPTGDDAVDAVLHLLEGEQPPQLTATYTITTKFGGTTRPATVVRDGDRRSVTIGDVRFLSDGDRQTCDLTTGACEDDIHEQRVSDTGVTSAFSAASPAQALRIALTRANGPAVASTETVGGQTATCVTVPSGEGQEETCAIGAGLVALWDTAAIDVRLDSFVPTVDGAAFQTTR